MSSQVVSTHATLTTDAPIIRPRRLRRTPALRRMVCETQLSVKEVFLGVAERVMIFLPKKWKNEMLLWQLESERSRTDIARVGSATGVSNVVASFWSAIAPGRTQMMLGSSASRCT